MVVWGVAPTTTTGGDNGTFCRFLVFLFVAFFFCLNSFAISAEATNIHKYISSREKAKEEASRNMLYNFLNSGKKNPFLHVDLNVISVNQCDEEGRNVVHLSVLKNRILQLRVLVNDGRVDLNKYDNSGMTPALYAVKSDSMFAYILHSGKFNMSLQDRVHKRSILHWALEMGKLKNAEMIIRSLPHLADLKDKNGETVLHLICRNHLVGFNRGPLEMVSAVMSGKALNDVSRLECGRNSALLLAIKTNSSSMVAAKFLLRDPRIDVNVQDSDGNTALNIACILARRDIISILMRNPATDMNARNALGRTPLFSFIRNAQISIDNIIFLTLLINQKRIDPNIPDNAGMTPLMYLLSDQRRKPFLLILLVSKKLSFCPKSLAFIKENAQSLRQQQPANALLNFKLGIASGETACENGKLLISAVREESTAKVRQLLSLNDSSINYSCAVEESGENALLVAAAGKNLEIFRVLLNNSYLTHDACTDFGRTVLHVTAANKNPVGLEMLEMALASGKVNISSSSSFLDGVSRVAISHNNVKALKKLLSHQLSSKTEINVTFLVMSAVKAGQPKILEFLIETFVRQPLKNHYYSEILCEAVKLSSDENKDESKDENKDEKKDENKDLNSKLNLEIVELLLNNGATLNFRDSSNKTVIWYACMKGKLSFLQYLVSRQFTNNNGNKGISFRQENQVLVALVDSFGRNRLKIAEFLLSQKLVDPNEKDPVNGMTALYLAYVNRDLEFARVIVEFSMEDLEFGKWLIHWFRSLGKDDMATLAKTKKQNNILNTAPIVIPTIKRKRKYNNIINDENDQDNNIVIVTKMTRRKNPEKIKI